MLERRRSSARARRPRLVVVRVGEVVVVRGHAAAAAPALAGPPPAPGRPPAAPAGRRAPRRRCRRRRSRLRNPSEFSARAGRVSAERKSMRRRRRAATSQRCCEGVNASRAELTFPIQRRRVRLATLWPPSSRIRERTLTSRTSHPHAPSTAAKTIARAPRAPPGRRRRRAAKPKSVPISVSDDVDQPRLQRGLAAHDADQADRLAVGAAIDEAARAGVDGGRSTTAASSPTARR